MPPAQGGLTLSDAFCVERYRAEFLALVAGHVDILFANEAEITALYQTASFEEALAAVRGHCEIAALTRSAKGSVLVSRSAIEPIPPVRVDRVLDTTGAGDLTPRECSTASPTASISPHRAASAASPPPR